MAVSAIVVCANVMGVLLNAFLNALIVTVIYKVAVLVNIANRMGVLINMRSHIGWVST